VQKIVTVCVMLCMLWSLVISSLYALEREQEDLYDFVKTSDVTIEKDSAKPSPSFYTYFWRIATAPLVVMFTFPFDEETDIYNTYLEYINKGSDRTWKKKEHTIEKKGFVNIEADREEGEDAAETKE